MVNIYRCRYCGKYMKESKPIIMKKKDILIGMNVVYTCSECGVVLIEHVFDYSPEQMKEIFK